MFLYEFITNKVSSENIGLDLNNELKEWRLNQVITGLQVSVSCYNLSCFQNFKQTYRSQNNIIIAVLLGKVERFLFERKILDKRTKHVFITKNQ